jgi:HJR/Mrr/RecB family endonuclease
LYADAVTKQNSELIFEDIIKNSELIFEELAFFNFYYVTIKTIYSVTNNNQNLLRG